MGKVQRKTIENPQMNEWGFEEYVSQRGLHGLIETYVYPRERLGLRIVAEETGQMVAAEKEAPFP